MKSSWLELLFGYEIRRYDPRGGLIDNWAFYFNLAEAIVWFVIALLILDRWRRFRRTSEEWLYAGLFFAFGLTDVCEAFVLQAWLLWVKGLVLAGILYFRRRLHQRHYPGWKTY
ncbi:MAG: hypothetical protein U0872_14315 [Planctomycetaceae bacterium]